MRCIDADAFRESLYRIMEWIPFETRPMDDEEREHWSTQLGYDIPEEEAVIFCSTLPVDGQEVLVCDKWGHVWIDEFRNDDYGVGLETNGDLNGVLAWMPLPRPMRCARMEIKKPLHKPKDGSCAWNEHVLCSSYSPSIWQYCDDIPPRCRGCGWNPSVSAARAEKIREVVINGKTA